MLKSISQLTSAANFLKKSLSKLQKFLLSNQNQRPKGLALWIKKRQPVANQTVFRRKCCSAKGKEFRIGEGGRQNQLGVQKRKISMTKLLDIQQNKLLVQQNQSKESQSQSKRPLKSKHLGRAGNNAQLVSSVLKTVYKEQIPGLQNKLKACNQIKPPSQKRSVVKYFNQFNQVRDKDNGNEFKLQVKTKGRSLKNEFRWAPKEQVELKSRLHKVHDFQSIRQYKGTSWEPRGTDCNCTKASLHFSKGKNSVLEAARWQRCSCGAQHSQSRLCDELKQVDSRIQALQSKLQRNLSQSMQQRLASLQRRIVRLEQRK